MEQALFWAIEWPENEAQVPDYVSYLAKHASDLDAEGRAQVRGSLDPALHPIFDTWVRIQDERATESGGRARKMRAQEAFNRLQANEDSKRMQQELLAAERGHVASRILTYSQLKDLPRPRPLIWNVCYSGAVGVVLGDSQTGKTWVMLSIAAAVARGMFWPAAPKDPLITPPDPMPVLYVAAEDGGSIGARLENWERAHDVDLSAFVFHAHPSAINLLDDVQIDELCEAVREQGYRLVIFDTVAASLGGEEEGNPQFSKVVQNMRKVIAATDGQGSVFLVHHFGKDKTKGGRGGSSLFNDSDIVWELTGTLDAMLMKCAKWKADSVRRPFHLRLDRSDETKVHVVQADTSSSSVNVTATTDPYVIIEQHIVKAVTEFADENQGYGPSGNTIAGYLRSKNVQFRETNFRDALALMSSDGRLIKHKGSRNAVLYRLPPEQKKLPNR